jgi:hypothetical protein
MPAPDPVTIAGAGTSARGRAPGPAGVIAMIATPNARDGRPVKPFKRSMSLLQSGHLLLERAKNGRKAITRVA